MTLEILTADCLCADNPAITHGFFTRKGGASSGIFNGLNCGYGSSDQTEAVTLNRARVAAKMGVVPDNLMSLHQIHSNTVVTITAPTTTDAPPPKADAMVTATPGIALAILTADCQPVLFADPSAGIIGAAHAGWRGALNGVLEATIDAMETLGAKRENIAAAIGPAISQTAYEVGTDFREKFLSIDPDSAQFFAAGNDGHYQFDLPAFGLMRLRAAKIGTAKWTRHCTYGDPDRFFSYRRTTHLKEADYGRLVSVIRI